METVSGSNFAIWVRTEMYFNRWYRIRDAKDLQAIKHLIDMRYGWDWFYLELDAKHERYRKREC